MRKINRKRLNNKGFTLIELLAVVVILAIVMGIAANGILNSINNSRRSSLLSAAKNAANTLNTWNTEDAVAMTDTDRTMDSTFKNSVKDSWVCITSSMVLKSGGSNLVKALGLNANDIIMDVSGATTLSHASATTEPNCSAIKYTNANGFELVLLAKDGGKFYVGADSVHYAYSRANAINEIAS